MGEGGADVAQGGSERDVVGRPQETVDRGAIAFEDEAHHVAGPGTEEQAGPLVIGMVVTTRIQDHTHTVEFGQGIGDGPGVGFGPVVTAVEGVRDIVAEKDATTFTVGSGIYTFEWPEA